MTPWHPALAHFPIALSVLSPFVTLLIVLGIRRKFFSRKVWYVAVLVQALTFTSGIVSFRTGEDEEHRMISNVPLASVHEHEEKAAEFLWCSGIGLSAGIAGAGFSGTPGLVFQVLSLIIQTGAVLPVIQTGKTGGELVYVHGAADVYVRENRAQVKK